MHPALREELHQQQHHDAEFRHAQALTLGDIIVESVGNQAGQLDRDGLLHPREIAAALLGLDARKRETYVNWAASYVQHVLDAEARDRLTKLIKWTALLLDEFKPGEPGRVRVDLALAFCESRGWIGVAPVQATGRRPNVLHRTSAMATEIDAAIARLGGVDSTKLVYEELLKMAADLGSRGCMISTSEAGIEYEVTHDDGSHSTQILNPNRLKHRLSRRRTDLASADRQT